MSPRKGYITIILLALFVLALGVTVSWAIDPPHDYGSYCTNCHNASLLSDYSGATSIDNTPIYHVCRSCHRTGGPNGATEKETHSARTTNSSHWSSAWTNDCTVCHDPHYQRQLRTYRTLGTYPNGPIVPGGTALSIVGNTLTASGNPGWDVGMWNGYTLIPNTNYYQYMYNVKSNTANSITVSAPIKTALLTGTKQFGFVYGRLMLSTVNAGHPITNSSGALFSSSYNRTVKLFNDTGPLSVLPTGAATDPSTASVCIVCHTQTKYNNYGKTLLGSTFDALPSDYSNHASTATSLCWDNPTNCHTAPAQGFAANAAKCGECHGTSMITGTSDLVVKIQEITNGLVGTRTLIPSIYNHPKHVNRYGSTACDYCHYQGMNPPKADLGNAAVAVGDYKLDMKFLVSSPGGYAYNTGIYKGFTSAGNPVALNSIYSYAGYSAGTPDNTSSCTNVYCHGFTLADGSNKVPTWRANAAVGCGPCHNATNATPPTSANHAKHAGTGVSTMFNAVECSICHPHNGSMVEGSVHVNGDVNVQFNAGNTVSAGGLYNGSSSAAYGPVPRGAYNTCTSLPCHGGVSAPVNAPVWGSTFTSPCTKCHGGPGWSSKHDKHVGTYTFTCNACHSTVAINNTTINSSNKSLHVNGTPNVVFNATTSGASANWGGTSCTSVTCHSTGNRIATGYGYVTSTTWTESLGCAGCHKTNDTAANMRSEASGVKNMTDVHVVHVANGGTGYAYTCNQCHKTTTTNGTTISSTTFHVNQVANVVYDTLAGASAAYSTGTYVCSNVYCHSNGADTPAYPATPNWSSAASGACGTCHGATSTGTYGSTVHNKHVKGTGGVYYACANCHSGIVSSVANSATQPTITDLPKHVDGIQNVVFGALPGGTASYNSGTGACSNIYCHSTGKVNLAVANLPAAYGGNVYNAASWGSGSTGCGSCHGRSVPDGRPDYTSGGPNKYDSNTHQSGTHAGAECRDCHNTTTGVGNAISSTKHADGAMDVSFLDGGTYNGSSQKDCTVTCHVGGYAHTGSQQWGSEADCFSCHGQPPINETGAGGMLSTSTGRAADFANGAGLHDYHYNSTLVGLSDCAYCHFGANGSTKHNQPQKRIEMAFSLGAYTGGWYQAPTFTAGSYLINSGDGVTTYSYPVAGARVCANLYCHSDGGNYAASFTYKTANWDAIPPTRQCNICHGTGGGAYVTTNVHPKHITTYAFGCRECHAATVTATNALIGNHVNAAKDVAFANMGAAGTYARPNCANTYCHSDGKNKVTPTHANVSWTGTTTCISCHDDAAAPTTNLTTAHTKHTLTTGYNIQCTGCHSEVVSNNTTVSSTVKHVNLVNTVDAGLAFSGGNCTTSYCHSAGTRYEIGAFTNASAGYATQGWSGTTTCTSCHKMADTYANMGAGTKMSTSHRKHLATDTYGAAGRGTYQITCNDCHYGTTNDGTTINALAIGNHTQGANDVLINIYNWGDTNAPVYDGGTRTCNNVYCHSYGSVNRQDVVYNATTADWDRATGLGCNGCHGFPPATADHSGQTKCVSCHSHSNNNDPTDGFSDLSLHINHAVDGGGCTTCHGQPPINETGAGGMLSTSTGRNTDFTNGAGLHDYHYNTTSLGFNNCAYCHNGANGSTKHNEAQKRIEMGFIIGSFQSGWYQAPTFSAGSYIINSGDGVTTYSYPVAGARVCANMYCHSDGGNYAASFTYKTANWDTIPPTRVCNICHGTPGGANATTDRHPKHVTTYTYTCVECHKDTVNAGGAIIGNHVNAAKNVAFGGTKSGDATTSYARPACSNSYCHSPGTLDSGFAAPVTAANWNDGAAFACDDCHGGAMADATKITTVAHATHINAVTEVGKSIACAECHKATALTNSTVAIGNHVDRLVSVKFDNVLNLDTDSPDYGGSTTGAAGRTKTPGSAVASCANVYCHSTGNSGSLVFNTVSWSAAEIGCDGCHSGGSGKAHPTYGSGAAGSVTANNHVAHVEGTPAMKCDGCHLTTTTDTAVPPTTLLPTGAHLNRTEDVSFKSIGGKTGEYISGVPNKNCNNTYCHGTTGPQWGAGTQACNACHESNSSLALRHDMHYGTTLTAGSIGYTNSSTASAYIYGCANCHPTATHSQGPSAFANQTAQVDGAMITAANWTAGTASNGVDSKGYSYSGNGSCANTYCHSNGKGTYASSIAWNTADSANCNVCHDDWNNSGAVADLSVRHTKHLQTYAANTNITCNACHALTVTAASNTVVGDKAQHVDGGGIDVSMNAWSAGTWGGTTCANVYCHSDGLATPAVYNTPDWSTATGCTSCHDDAAAPTTTLSAPHTKHTLTTGMNKNCQTCHSTVVTGSATINNYALHVNKTREVDAFWSSPNCTTSYCHSTGTRWNIGGGSTSAYATQGWSGGTTCISCHSSANTYANMGVGTLMSTSHRAHLATDRYGLGSRGGYQIKCDDCHYGTSNDGTTINALAIGNHTQGTNDVLIPIGEWGANAAYATGTRLCTNVYCHSDGKGVFENTKADWDRATALDCTGCHGNPPSTPHTSDTDCQGCHGHVNGTNNGFDDYTKHINGGIEGGGESAGGSACEGCHSTLYNRMHMGQSNTVYKHFMNSAATGYPADSQPAVGATTRTCLMCHVDHDIFRPDINVGIGNRAKNLRTSVTLTPTTSTNFTGGDFDATTGGVCLSCHWKSQTKAIATNDGVQTLPALPTADIASQNAARDMFRNSSHNYAVLSGSFLDGSKFNATCLKCHNDTFDADPVETGFQKSGVDSNGKKGAQSAEPRFGLHVSANNLLLAPMGQDRVGEFTHAGKVTAYSAGIVTVSNTFTKDYTGYTAVITNTSGAAVRAEITASNGTDTITASWGSYLPQVNDLVEITKMVVPADEVCFNCHSTTANNYKLSAGYDYYGTKKMTSKIESMYNLFVGDSGKLRAATGKNATTVYACTAKTVGADAFANYTIVIGSYRGKITTHLAPASDGTCSGTYGLANVMTLTVSSTPILAAGSTVDILKPATHPLDKLGRHSPDEMMMASATKPTTLTTSWNVGDSGSCTAASTTTCTDSTKSWATNQWGANVLQITYASGTCAGQSFNISSNSANVVTHATAACTPAAGDGYYVGNRHVSCGDCHNTHSAQKKPAGEGGSPDMVFNTAYFEDYLVNTTNTNWGTDTFEGQILMVVAKNGTDTGLRQIRTISASTTDATKTRYTVAIAFTAWSGTAPTQYEYEVVKQDGSTGPGGKGIWGVHVSGWTTGGQNPSTFTYTKFYDAGGDVGGKQYEQCLRCHSYYAFRGALPNTPSGHPSSTGGPGAVGLALATDIAGEINPFNKAHHAVVQVGKNQPIGTTGLTVPSGWTGALGFNPSWMYESIGNCTLGYAVDPIAGYTNNIGHLTACAGSANTPAFIQPGWYAKVGTEWYQVVHVVAANDIWVAKTNGNPWDTARIMGTGDLTTGSYAVYVTAGLGNAFIPPYGPWSILRCTDCHGSTLEDPAGPHASVNKYMLKSLDTAIKFQTWDTLNNVMTVPTNPNNAGAPSGAEDWGYAVGMPKNYFCYNCHDRRNYYDSAQTDRVANNSRVPHGVTWEGNSNASTSSETAWGVNCRHCHTGEAVGRIHGANTTNAKRFLNGSSWGGSTTQTQVRGNTNSAGACYTTAVDDNDVNTCSTHGGTKTSASGVAPALNAYYNYDNP